MSIGEVKIVRIESMKGTEYIMIFHDSMGGKSEVISININSGIWASIVNQIKHLEIMEKRRDK